MGVPTEVFRWWIRDRDSGKLRKTQHRMTERYALENYPGATPVEGSKEIRMLPDPEELRIARASRSRTVKP